MTETKWLFEEIRERFGEHPAHDDVHDWLLGNQWEIMKHMFPGCGELLHALSDDTYDRVVEDLVKDDFGDGLAERLINLEFDIQEDE